jgi:hypothetical protein
MRASTTPKKKAGGMTGITNGRRKGYLSSVIGGEFH